jgi:hypothetical protein
VLPDLGVCVITSVEKWTKLKAILQKWSDRLGQSTLSQTKLSHKELLSDQGFLVYVTRTYPAMVPYLKGFHLTIEMWRGGRDADGWKRDADGWKLPPKEDDPEDDQYDEDAARVRHRLGLKQGGPDPEVYAPKDGFTTPVPRLVDDVAALIQLSQFKLPAIASGEALTRRASVLRIRRRVRQAVWSYPI